MADSGV